MKSISDNYKVNATVNNAISAAVDQFLQETMTPRVMAALQSPQTIGRIERKVKAVLKDRLAEKETKGTWDGGTESALEVMIGDQIEQMVHRAINTEMAQYFKFPHWRADPKNNAMEVEKEIQKIVRAQVAQRLSALPETLDTFITKFIEDVKAAKIPAGVLTELREDLWGTFIGVVANRFREMLGMPVSEDD